MLHLEIPRANHWAIDAHIAVAPRTWPCTPGPRRTKLAPSRHPLAALAAYAVRHHVCFAWVADSVGIGERTTVLGRARPVRIAVTHELRGANLVDPPRCDPRQVVGRSPTTARYRRETRVSAQGEIANFSAEPRRLAVPKRAERGLLSHHPSGDRHDREPERGHGGLRRVHLHGPRPVRTPASASAGPECVTTSARFADLQLHHVPFPRQPWAYGICECGQSHHLDSDLRSRRGARLGLAPDGQHRVAGGKGDNRCGPSLLVVRDQDAATVPSTFQG